ncbi:hypothetical protein HMPREF0742_01576 [Rothia aeria F0184]|uniref:Uncharacterized protein n=1 Tax=Rothia aeria F0184 TaxID=888019 RepID=U7V2R0_9MICC|nr:hypothetical protein HMPREF0742_01576 [Rothia aeria F0184]
MAVLPCKNREVQPSSHIFYGYDDTMSLKNMCDVHIVRKYF